MNARLIKRYTRICTINKWMVASPYNFNDIYKNLKSIEVMTNYACFTYKEHHASLV